MNRQRSVISRISSMPFRILMGVILAIGSLSFDHFSLYAAPKPVNFECSIGIDKAISLSELEFSITIVTNDSKSNVVHFLYGSLNRNNGFLEGDVKEYFSDRTLNLDTEGFGGVLQPFSAHRTGKTHVILSNPKTITIKWDGGGTTVNKFTCTSSNTLIWHDASYSAIMTYKEKLPVR